MALLPKDPKLQKKILIAMAPVLVAGLFYWFVQKKQNVKIAELQTRVEEMETKNATARGMAAQGGPQLEKKLKIYEQHMVRLEQLIPHSEEVPELLHAMTLRAREADVELGLMRPEEEQPGDYYTLQTYEMSVLGSYHDIGRFLSAVGSLPRIITPIDMKLRPRDGQTTRRGQALAEALFRIQTYIVPTSPAGAKQEATSAST